MRSRVAAEWSAPGWSNLNSLPRDPSCIPSLAAGMLEGRQGLNWRLLLRFFVGEGQQAASPAQQQRQTPVVCSSKPAGTHGVVWLLACNQSLTLSHPSTLALCRLGGHSGGCGPHSSSLHRARCARLGAALHKPACCASGAANTPCRRAALLRPAQDACPALPARALQAFIHRITAPRAGGTKSMCTCKTRRPQSQG